MVGGGALTDWISLGVLASSVPRDAVDEAVAVTGQGARRAGGKLPPHVMVYFVMALALFADEDYEEVAARLTEALRGWGCWDWEVPTKGAVTQARQRLGPEVMAEVFRQVAAPVAGLDTAGAFLGPWRLMSVDGMEWDVPDTAANRAFFGVRGTDRAALPKARVVTVSECASHAAVLAAVGPASGGKGSGEQSLARRLFQGLEQDWLLIADRAFYSWAGWGAAARTGAALLWRAPGERPAGAAGDAARRVVPVRVHRAEDFRPPAPGPPGGGPARGGPRPRRRPACPGDRVRRPGPGRETARAS